MSQLENDFDIRQTFNTHEAVVVQRAIRRRDGLAVILKHPAATVPHESEIARLKYELDVLTALRPRVPGPEVIKPVGLWGHDDSTTLVLEDIGGLSLADTLETATLSIPQAIAVAQQILLALQQVHAAGVLHKDVNPRNIVYVKHSGQVQLIDFGIAAQMHQETAVAKTLAVEGTLSYAPPEQMGRLSRHADHRTDYYSLGATLYELACGAAPFVIDDPAQLMHAILTTRPVPPSERSERVPPALSAVIMKLLEKAQEARYQSVRGIRADLDTCLNAPAPFALGREDSSETFALPNRLYGRDSELAALRARYHEATARQRVMVFVGGSSGVGKSALIAELHAEMLGHQALFLSGKCDQLRRHLPFSALEQALSGLIRFILLEPAEKLDLWRRRVQGALGASAQVLIEIFPALEWLIGQQKPAVSMPARESDNRLHALLQQLLAALTEEHPLVLFLDDLQWADTGTIKFLQGLATSALPTAGICALAAYRNDEIASEHLFAQLCRSLPESHPNTHAMTLAPLALPSTCALVASATGTSERECAELATLVHDKTAGNPFFARAYLTHLHEHGLLVYNFAAQRWTWDVQALRTTSVTDNVVALLTQKLRALPADITAALSIGACLGDRFELDALVRITDIPRDALVQSLSEGVAHGLLLANTDDYRYAAHTRVDVVYKFAHDRVQQAAFGLLQPEQARDLHWRITQTMMQRYRANPAHVSLFELMGHLEGARGVPHAQEERLELARLGLVATLEAKRAAAHDIARTYVDLAWEVLGADPWAADRTLARQLQVEIADCEFMHGAVNEALVRFDSLVPHTSTDLERGELDVRRIFTLVAASRNEDAVREGLAALRRLGYTVRRSMALLVLNLARTLYDYRHHGPDTLPLLPESTDPRSALIIELISSISTPSYHVAPDVYAMLAVMSPRLTIKYGISRMSGQSVGALGIAMMQLNRPNTARRLSRASRRIVEVHAKCAYRSAIEWCSTLYVDFLDLSLAETVERSLNAYELGLRTGDPIFAGWAAAFAGGTVWPASLRRCLEACAAYRGYVDDHGETAQQLTLNEITLAGQLLTGHIDRGAYDQLAHFEAIRAEKSAGGAHAVVFRTMTYWLWGDSAKAWDVVMHASQTDVFRGAVEYLMPYYSLYGCLAYCDGLARQVPRRLAERVRFAQMRTKLRMLANTCTQGQLTGLDVLVDAVHLSARGQHDKAFHLWDGVLRAVEKSEFLLLRATAYECVGRFYQGQGHSTAANAAVHRSMQLYRLWGSSVKVDRLHQEFPAVTHDAMNPAESNATPIKTRTGRQRTAEGLGTDGDMVPLRRLAQVLNAGLTFEQLAETALSCMAEATSASRAILAFRTENAASRYFDSLAGRDRPEAIMALTTRSRQILCVDDAVVHPELRQDAYVVQHHLKSILCMPAMRQGEVQGVVYLENDDTPGVFTPARVRLLELLVPQIAMAFENRAFSEAMEQKVAAQTERLKQTGEKLLQLEKDQAEAQMAGGFAHEMRNALGGVGYILPTLLRTPEFGDHGETTLATSTLQSLTLLRDSSSDSARQAALQALFDNAEILRSSLLAVGVGVHRGLSITGQILDYAQASRIVAGSAKTELGQLVQSILADYQSTLAAQRVECDVHIPPNSTCFISAPHASTIIQTLLSNARDALVAREDTGPRRIQVQVHTEASNLRLSVVDNGVGMSAETQRRLYEPFFSTKGTKGAGLGLALSRKIVTAYGGKIACTSEANTGTTFALEIPR